MPTDPIEIHGEAEHVIELLPKLIAIPERRHDLVGLSAKLRLEAGKSASAVRIRTNAAHEPRTNGRPVRKRYREARGRHGRHDPVRRPIRTIEKPNLRLDLVASPTEERLWIRILRECPRSHRDQLVRRIEHRLVESGRTEDGLLDAVHIVS